MSDGVIIGVGPIAENVKAMLVYMDDSARVLSLTEVVVHEVDCQLYGNIFRNHCNDPLMDIYEALAVPTDYRFYISKYLFEAVEDMLDRTIGRPLQHWSYVVDWLSDSTGVLHAWPDRPAGSTDYNTPPSIGRYTWEAA